MSHTSKCIGVPVRDISALRSAVADLQASGISCALVENAKPRMYYTDQTGVMPYVVQLKNGRYDIGFEQQSDGSYVPVFDNWGGHVEGQVGASCPMPHTEEGRLQHAIGKVMQGYSKHAAINAAQSAGHTVENCWVDDAGNVQLEIAAFA